MRVLSSNQATHALDTKTEGTMDGQLPTASQGRLAQTKQRRSIIVARFRAPQEVRRTALIARSSSLPSSLLFLPDQFQIRAPHYLLTSRPQTTDMHNTLFAFRQLLLNSVDGERFNRRDTCYNIVYVTHVRTITLEKPFNGRQQINKWLQAVRVNVTFRNGGSMYVSGSGSRPSRNNTLDYNSILYL